MQNSHLFTGLENLVPDVTRFINTSWGKSSFSTPPLVEFLVDDMHHAQVQHRGAWAKHGWHRYGSGIAERLSG